MRKRKKEATPRFLELPEHSGRVFAFGDIHGCCEELNFLIEHIVGGFDLTEEDILLFIGDYIDRGPASREVVDLLLALENTTPARLIFLKGNHEDMFLSFLGFEGTLGQGYLLNGGLETLASYGCKEFLPPEELVNALPPEHVQFFRTLERYVIIGDYVFAHAGLNPLRDLRFQLDDDLFWIREEFIANMHYFEKTVVFGHTPFEDVLFHLPYKVGIDTGLVYGSMLSCVEVRDELVLQIELKEKTVKEFSFADKSGRWPQNHDKGKAKKENPTVPEQSVGSSDSGEGNSE